MELSKSEEEAHKVEESPEDIPESENLTKKEEEPVQEGAGMVKVLKKVFWFLQ